MSIAIFHTIYFELLYVVVKIQFASATFTGSESSGEIIVTVLATGAISDNKINVMVTLTKGTAKG